jgi:3'-5' exonuclease
MTPILVFDIETIPDIKGLRALYEIAPEVSDDAVAAQAFAARKEKTGSEFLPHVQHQICAISCVLREGDANLAVWSLGNADDDEPAILKKFFALFDRYTPQLVSWNGSGFDMPVLHYRAMVHAIEAPRYWDWGDDDRDFKYNNYLNRYHTRHIDLMDVLAQFSARAYAPLDDLAKLCGLPGKLGMDGGQVWPAFQRGEIGKIRDYCETDVVNTYLLYLRFMRLRGQLDAAPYAAELQRMRDRLNALPGTHWKAYLSAWQ